MYQNTDAFLISIKNLIIITYSRIKKPWNIKLFGEGEHEDKEAEIAIMVIN